jgi:integrase
MSKVRKKPATISEAFEAWLVSEVHPGTTVRRYRHGLRRLALRGLARLEDVTAERVEALQRESLALGYSPVYVRGDLGALRTVLSFSVPRGWFPREVNDAIRAVPLPTDPPRQRLRAKHLSRDEVEHLARTAAEVLPRVELPIRVAALSGLRTTELARVRAEDARERLLHVETVPELGEQGSCKTGPRTVPMCAELVAIFRDRLPSSGYVFLPESATRNWANRRREFVSAWSLRRDLKRVVQAAGMDRDVLFRVLRHTRASWWLQAGVSIHKVAFFMGHTVETCELFYGGLLDRYDADCERMPALEGVKAWPTS